MRSCVLLLVVIASCSDPSPPAVSATEERAPEATAAPSPPAASPEAPEVAAPAAPSEPLPARAAYLALVAAYNRGDRAVYEAALAPQLRCFHDERDVPRERVAARRFETPGALAIASLVAVEASVDRVVLLDRGFFSAGERQVLHEKLVALERVEGGWRLVAEVSARAPGCLEGIAAPRGDPRFAACRDGHGACMSACSDGACRDGCRDVALACLGLRRVAAEPTRVVPTAILRTDAAAAVRFVELALRAQLEGTGGSIDRPAGDPEAIDEAIERERGELEALYAQLAPTEIALSGPDGTDIECGRRLFSGAALEVAGVYGALAAREGRCTENGERCVVSLDVPVPGGALRPSFLHLLFDGPRVRAAVLLPATDADLDAELARFATERPAAWSADCRAIEAAFVGRRAGADFFEVSADFDEVEVERSCGAEAEAHVRGLRTAFEDLSLGAACGNWCEEALMDGEHIAGLYVGMDGGQPSGEALATIRERVACGASKTFSIDEWPD